MKFLYSFIFSAMVSTTSLAQSLTLTLSTDSSFKDAIVETYDSNLNRGNDDIAYVQAWTFSGLNIKRYYFEFDFSKVPANAIIDSAKISFTNGSTSAQNQQHQGLNSWSIRRVTQPWIEQNITWSNQPTSSSQNKTIIQPTVSPYQSFIHIDITSLVTDAINLGNHGFVAQLEDEDPFKRVVFATSDNADPTSRPSLILFYHLCTAIPAFSYSVNPGKTLSFTNTSTTSSTPSYLWDFGDGTFSSQANPTKTYPVQGTYNVCLTISNSCDTNTTCQTISTCAPAQCQMQYTINNNLVQFRARPANALSYWWDFGDGNFSLAKNTNYAYSSYGLYKVCLAVTDTCGTDTTCSSLLIEDISLEDLALPQFSIYPNPASEFLNISGDLKSINSITLYSIAGQKIQSLEPSLLPLNISQYISGSYIVEFNTEFGNSYVRLLKL